MPDLPAALLGGLQAAAPPTATSRASASAPAAQVQEGALVAVMEAMKMETQVLAHRAGRLVRLLEPGAYVGAGAPIARIG